MIIPSPYAQRLAVRAAVWIAAGWLALASSSATAETISLGAASDFAVLGGSTVTNTGATNITGNVGVSPGTAITGLSSGSVNGGTIHGNDAASSQAHADVFSAFTQLSLELPTTNLTGVTFGAGLTLTPGTYRFDSTALLNGALNLDFGNDPTAAFHFQIGSALTTASHSSILLLNGSSNNVFWEIGSSATLGTDTHFAGTILAAASITLNTGSTLDGRALAISGAVTMDTNQVAIDPSVVLSTGGTLLLQSDRQLTGGAAVTLAGGTLDLNGHTAEAAGKLTLTATSTLDFGAAGKGNSLIRFASIGGATNLGDHIILQITNWQGTPGTGGGVEQLLFGGSAAEFTTRFSQSEVTFEGVAGYTAVQFSGYYEITSPLSAGSTKFAEVPEPGTIFGGLALLGMVGYRERRRVAAWWKRAQC